MVTGHGTIDSAVEGLKSGAFDYLSKPTKFDELLVKVEAARTVLESGASIGDELLNRLSDEGRDLLVMGCYGHSRMHEFVFGGVTRDILANMTAPVLLSH